jgi:hypothetical protein
MSAPRTTHHTIAGAVTAAATASVLLVLGGAAAADPPGLDFDPCVNTLERAAQWPGTLGDGSRQFSDGFDSYLSRQPVCFP